MPFALRIYICNLPSIWCAIGVCWRAKRIWRSCGNIKITPWSPYGHRRCYKRGWRMFTTGPEAISAAWRPRQMRLKAMRTIHNSLISMMFMHFSRRANSFNWTVLVKYKAFSAHGMRKQGHDDAKVHILYHLFMIATFSTFESQSNRLRAWTIL